MQRKIGFVILGLAAVLVGCSGNSTSGGGLFNQPAPRIRAINALDGVSTASWSVTGQNNITFPAIPFGTVTGSVLTPYVILNERGQQTVNFYNSAAPTVVVASASHDFVYSDKITVVAYGSAPGNTVTLTDQTTNSTNGPNVRVVDAALQTGNLDVFITPTGVAQAGTPSLLTPGSVYPAQNANGSYVYFSLPLPGSYTVNAYHQGADTGTPVFSTTLNVANTDVYTLVLVDPAPSGGTPSVLQIQDNNSDAG